MIGGPQIKRSRPYHCGRQHEKSSSKNGLSHSWYKKGKSPFRSSFVGHLFMSCTTA